MRTRVRTWLLCLFFAAAFQAGAASFGGPSLALADTVCPTGTNWDSVTHQCR